MGMLARLVGLVTTVVVGLIVVGIVLVLLEANRGNDVVNAVLDAGRWLTTPFHGIFDPDDAKLRTAVNWGLAALVYSLAGGLVVRLLSRR